MLDDALPVAVDLSDADLSADVTAHIESVLGWQVLEPGPHLPVRLTLADTTDPVIPTVVVTRSADGDTARAQLRRGALDVLVWPDDAARLEDLVPDPTVRRPADQVIAVAGARGGVGTSTVALALGGLHAWAGRRTVVVTDVAGRRLAGVQGEGRTRVAGVEDLWVAGDMSHAVGDAHPLDVLVVDRGIGGRAQVLVGQPDAALIDALVDHPPTAAVVTTGEGGMHARERARLISGRRHVALSRTFRVARAGLRGRVPVGLPGTYLGALGVLVDDGGGST